MTPPVRYGLAPAVLMVLLASSGCGSDTPPTAPVSLAPGVVGIVASGAVTAAYPKLDASPCELANGQLTIHIREASGATQPLILTLRGFHGQGVYADLLGPAASSGVTVELDSLKEPRWIGSAGSITVTLAAFTRVVGHLKLSMRPDNGATGTVDLIGDWSCTEPSPAPPTF